MTLRISVNEECSNEQVANNYYINATKLENCYLEQVGLSNYFLENECQNCFQKDAEQ